MTLKFIQISILISLSTICAGQHHSGLYGECNGPSSGYLCQQILLGRDGHFEFYDYLHLKGEKINKGSWSLDGDTVLLNSLKQPKIVFGKNHPDKADITIYFRDTNNNPIEMERLYVNSDSLFFSSDSMGMIVLPQRTIRKLSYSIYPNVTVLNFTDAELLDVSELILYNQYDWNESIFFKDEKWLISNQGLMYSRLPSGQFDTNKFFKKTTLRNQRFNSK